MTTKKSISDYMTYIIKTLSAFSYFLNRLHRSPINDYRSVTSNRLLIAAICVLFSFSAWAQQPTRTWEEGDIEDVKIDIVQQRQITLPKANRNFEKIPPRASEPITPPIKYDFQSFSFLAPQVNPQIRPLKLKPSSPSNVYGGFVRAGYGNYASPLLEGYINSRKDKEKLVGAHFYHHSSAKGPVDDKNSGNGNTTFSLFGKSFNENIALSGNADFENRTTHFYGYPEGAEVNRSDIKQAYNLFKIGGDLSNTRSTDFSYKLGARFNYLQDKYEAKETEVDVMFNSAYALNDDSKINVNAAYYIISRKDSEVEAKPRNLFTATPSYAFMPIEGLKLSIGFTVAYENDTLDSKDLHLYPAASVSYPVSPSVDFVASLRGGMDKVSLQSLSYENIWLAPNVPIYHTNKNYELNVGINSRLGNKVAANAGLSMATFRNMYFFVNSEEDQSKFDVVYDEGFTRRTNVYGALSYAQTESVKFMLRGDYFLYGTDDLPEAWHKPTYKLTANTSFNIYQKLLITVDLIAQGGMKALEPVTGNTIKLDGAFDLNGKLEYLFSPGFSAFVQLNNLTSNKYPVYLYYPVRGFQAIGGITWSF